MEEKRGKLARLKTFWNESIRVLKVTKKPNKEEFIVIVKVSGLGIVAIGLVGFLVTMIKQALF